MLFLQQILLQYNNDFYIENIHGMKLFHDDSIIELLELLLATATSLIPSCCIIKEIFNLITLMGHQYRFICIAQLCYQNK